MRVTKYDMLLNEEQHPYLVKEESRNCPNVDKMTSPEKIKKVMDDVFNASYLAEEHVWVIAMNAKRLQRLCLGRSIRKRRILTELDDCNEYTNNGAYLYEAGDIENNKLFDAFPR